jgi:hypothetical protein
MGLGDIMGAVGGMFGGVLDKRKYDKQHQYQTHVEQRNRAHDLAFAQNAIQWKVADAKKAGIHPLVALGANPITPSATMVGSPPSHSTASAMSNMGQDISRAMSAHQTKADKELTELGLDNARIDNQMKRIELNEALKRSNIGTKPMPALDQQTYESPDVKKTPSEVFSSVSGGTVQAGQNPAYRFHKVGKGKYTMTLSESMKQAVEDSPQELQQQLNMLLNFSGKAPFKAPKGKMWDYNYVTGTVELVSERKAKVSNKKTRKNRRGWFSFGAGR